MSPIGAALLFFVVVGAVLFVIYSLQRGHRPRSVLLASLAGRWNGRIREGGVLSGDRLELQVEDVNGIVTFGEGPEGEFIPSGWTRVQFNWPCERRLRVITEGIIGSQIRRIVGGSDIEFDDPPFDDRFWVESSHPVWARGLLVPETRRSLVRLQWSPNDPSSDNLALDVGPAGVTLRVSRILIDHADTLGVFIELAISILRKARGLTDAVGVALEPVRTRAGSVCPVCGHPVTDALLACPSCRTPHHRECWGYFGGCAIFGCRTRTK